MSGTFSVADNVMYVIVGRLTQSLDYQQFIHVMVTSMVPGHKATQRSLNLSSYVSTV